MLPRQRRSRAWRAIVRELVMAMGGEVSAESVVGEGGRLSFALPFVEQATRVIQNGHKRDTTFTNR